MLHVWLIPALIVLFLLIGGFYVLVKYKGGTGARTPGKTLIDNPSDETDLPP